MTPLQKQWIDEASYEELFYKWRYEPPGSDWFIGETGEYYAKVLKEKKNALTFEQQVAASKAIDRRHEFKIDVQSQIRSKK